MCKLYCFDKLAELSKKHQLQNMLNNNAQDMLDNPLDRDKILDFIQKADCCKNCKNNMATKLQK